MAASMWKFLKPKKALADESGSMTFFVTIMFTTMIGVAGIAIDIARFEASRTEIQAHLDNATLAAASLRQTASAQSVLDSYMQTAGLDATYSANVTDSEEGLATYRRVETEATVNIDTYFMRLFGVDDLGLKVTSIAEERIPRVEVSLVLDISGSMDGTRLNNLQPAAKEFIDTLLGANDDVNPHRVSISLIPYNMQVNAGQRLFTEVYGTPEHHHSYCAEWDYTSFGENGFSTNGMEQAMAMAYRNNGNHSTYTTYGSLDAPYCRDEEFAQILPFSNDADALKTQIDNLQARGNTSIDIGVKWGAALLDPSARPVVQALATEWQLAQDDQGNDIPGEYATDPVTGYKIKTNRQAIEPGFSDRPVDYPVSDGDTSNETLKALVVMTDGENTTEYRVKSNRRGSGGSGVYYNDSNGAYNFAYQTGWRELSWTETWTKVPLYTYNRRKGGAWYHYWDSNLGNYAKNQNLSSVCANARENNVVIFTIAYSATPNGKAALLDCAGDQAFAHEADVTNIDDVFAEIGGVIEKLKLTQ